MLIYKIEFPNNKVYVGITTKNLQIRKNNHKRALKKSKLLVHKAMKKYRFDSLKWEILEFCNSKEELYFLEKYYIKYFNSNNLNIGYNLTEGGDGVNGLTHSEKTRNILSQKSKEQWLNSSLEHKEKNRLQAYKYLAGSNKISIIDNFGNIFNSILDASRYHNISDGLVRISLKNKQNVKNNTLCFIYYSDNIVKPNLYKNKKFGKINTKITEEQKELMSKRSPFSKKIKDKNGNIYRSINYACKKLKTTRHQIYIKIKSGEFFYV